MESTSETDEQLDGLPTDTALANRKEMFEKLFKDYAQVEDGEELSLSQISAALNNEDEEQDSDLEICEPEAEVAYMELVPLDKRTEKTLQKAVQRREDDWKQRGIRFTFEKVDEWLRRTQSSIHKRLANGDDITENKQCVEKHFTRVAAFDDPRVLRPAHLDQKFLEDRLKPADDDDDDSSVDTAKYILANRKRGASSVHRKTMVIKKYHITKETVEVHEIEERPRSNTQKFSPAHKRRRRRTRGELNKLHDGRVILLDSDSDVPGKKGHHSSDESPPKKLKSSGVDEKLPTKSKTPLSETEDESDEQTIAENKQENQSICSNLTAKSLPKRISIYTPDGKTKGQVLITNQHFVTALGENLAKEVLKNVKIDRKIDANSEVVLQMPSTDPEDTDEDFCVKVNRRPLISVIPSETCV